MRKLSSHLFLLMCLSVIGLAGWIRGEVSQAEAPGVQVDLKPRVAQAAELFHKDPSSARVQLQRLGSPAIPFIAEIICSEDDQIPVKKVTRDPFLVDVIAEYANKPADDALVKLLSSKCPNIRGLAAQYIGNRKTESAIPRLVSLLADKDVYIGYAVTHGQDYEVLVRDMAIEALQKITGKKMATRSSKDAQAHAWVNWWKKQQSVKTPKH